jgi:UDP-galactopyranose mutase
MSKQFNEPFYSLSNQKDRSLYDTYKKQIKKYSNIHLLGRIAEYKYFDMDDAIANAMSIFDINHDSCL